MSSPSSSTVGEIILDFQSIDFESDKAILTSFLLDYQQKRESSLLSENRQEPQQDSKRQDDPKETSPLFDIASPKYVGGWYFSQIRIHGELASIIHQFHYAEIDNINIKKAAKALGKQYQGDESVIKFAAWLDKSLKGLGCKAQIKIGEEMANLGYGVGQTVFGLALGRLLSDKLDKT